MENTEINVMSYKGQVVRNFTQHRKKKGEKTNATPLQLSLALADCLTAGARERCSGGGISDTTWRLCFTGHRHVVRPVVNAGTSLSPNLVSTEKGFPRQMIYGERRFRTLSSTTSEALATPSKNGG